nr:hypothetical protein [Tanacetum cinerariifolium]
RRRITVVIGGQRWRSTTVAGGEPPLTTARPPLTTTGPPINGGWWAGQRLEMGRSGSDSGLVNFTSKLHLGLLIKSYSILSEITAEKWFSNMVRGIEINVTETSPCVSANDFNGVLCFTKPRKGTKKYQKVESSLDNCWMPMITCSAWMQQQPPTQVIYYRFRIGQFHFEASFRFADKKLFSWPLLRLILSLDIIRSK